MAITIIRLESPGGPGEGIGVGTVRRPTRGIRKQDYVKKTFIIFGF